MFESGEQESANWLRIYGMDAVWLTIQWFMMVPNLALVHYSHTKTREIPWY